MLRIVASLLAGTTSSLLNTLHLVDAYSFDATLDTGANYIKQDQEQGQPNYIKVKQEQEQPESEPKPKADIQEEPESEPEDEGERGDLYQNRGLEELCNSANPPWCCSFQWEDPRLGKGCCSVGFFFLNEDERTWPKGGSNWVADGVPKTANGFFQGNTNSAACMPLVQAPVNNPEVLNPYIETASYGPKPSAGSWFSSPSPQPMDVKSQITKQIRKWGHFSCSAGDYHDDDKCFGPIGDPAPKWKKYLFAEYSLFADWAEQLNGLSVSLWPVNSKIDFADKKFKNLQGGRLRFDDGEDGSGGRRGTGALYLDSEYDKKVFADDQATTGMPGLPKNGAEWIKDGEGKTEEEKRLSIIPRRRRLTSNTEPSYNTFAIDGVSENENIFLDKFGALYQKPDQVNLDFHATSKTSTSKATSVSGATSPLVQKKLEGESLPALYFSLRNMNTWAWECDKTNKDGTISKDQKWGLGDNAHFVPKFLEIKVDTARVCNNSGPRSGDEPEPEDVGDITTIRVKSFAPKDLAENKELNTLYKNCAAVISSGGDNNYQATGPYSEAISAENKSSRISFDGYELRDTTDPSIKGAKVAKLNPDRLVLKDKKKLKDPAMNPLYMQFVKDLERGVITVQPRYERDPNYSLGVTRYETLGVLDILLERDSKGKDVRQHGVLWGRVKKSSSISNSSTSPAPSSKILPNLSSGVEGRGDPSTQKYQQQLQKAAEMREEFEKFEKEALSKIPEQERTKYLEKQCLSDDYAQNYSLPSAILQESVKNEISEEEWSSDEQEASTLFIGFKASGDGDPSQYNTKILTPVIPYSVHSVSVPWSWTLVPPYAYFGRTDLLFQDLAEDKRPNTNGVAQDYAPGTGAASYCGEQNPINNTATGGYVGGGCGIANGNLQKFLETKIHLEPAMRASMTLEQRKKIKKIVFGGHSLGGATALIAAAHYNTKAGRGNLTEGLGFPNVETVSVNTFGAPPIAQGGFVEYLRDQIGEENLLQVLHEDDSTVNVGVQAKALASVAWKNGYVHAATQTQKTTNGKTVDFRSPAMLGKRRSSPLYSSGRFWTGDLFVSGQGNVIPLSPAPVLVLPDVKKSWRLCESQYNCTFEKHDVGTMFGVQPFDYVRGYKEGGAGAGEVGARNLPESEAKDIDPGSSHSSALYKIAVEKWLERATRSRRSASDL